MASLERLVPPLVRQIVRRPRDRRFVYRMLPRGGVGAEIGVWKGDFSRAVLRRVHPRELHLIDPWAHPSDPRYALTWYGRMTQEEMDAIYAAVCSDLGGNPAVVIHRGRSIDVAPELPDMYFDWVYIDGDHSYEGALGDLVAWVPKVKPGGLVVCDDYFSGGSFIDGVKPAVDSYTGAHGFALTVKARQAFFRTGPATA
jgi:hypothetical protein